MNCCERTFYSIIINRTCDASSHRVLFNQFSTADFYTAVLASVPFWLTKHSHTYHSTRGCSLSLFINPPSPGSSLDNNSIIWSTALHVCCNRKAECRKPAVNTEAHWNTSQELKLAHKNKLTYLIEETLNTVYFVAKISLSLFMPSLYLSSHTEWTWKILVSLRYSSRHSNSGSAFVRFIVNRNIRQEGYMYNIMWGEGMLSQTPEVLKWYFWA